MALDRGGVAGPRVVKPPAPKITPPKVTPPPRNRFDTEPLGYTPKSNFVNPVVLTATQLLALRGRGSIALNTSQAKAITNIPDINPDVVSDILSRGKIVLSANPATSHFNPATKNITLGEGGYRYPNVVGHELVHAWYDSNPWANPVVAATTMMNIGRASVVAMAPNSKMASVEMNTLRAGYTHPLSNEWLASKYYGPAGTNQRGRSTALRGFLR